MNPFEEEARKYWNQAAKATKKTGIQHEANQIWDQVRANKGQQTQYANQPADMPSELPTSSQMLANIYQVAATGNTSAANDMMSTFKTFQQNPSSPWYAPYNSHTNQAVDALTGLGIDLNDKDWYAKTAFLDQYLIFSDTTNTPTKPGKKASDKQVAAYQRYQWGKANNQTQEARKEWADFQREIYYWVNQPDRNYSNDEILEKIYGPDFVNGNYSDKFKAKYPLLAKMEESLKPGGTLLEMNEGIGYSRDALIGTIWAARNGGGYDDMDTNIAMSALGEGNQWKYNAELAERRDPTSDSYNILMGLKNRSDLDKALLFNQLGGMINQWNANYARNELLDFWSGKGDWDQGRVNGLLEAVVSSYDKMADQTDELKGSTDTQTKASDDMTAAAQGLMDLPGQIEDAVVNGMSGVTFTLDGQVITNYVNQQLGQELNAERD